MVIGAMRSARPAKAMDHRSPTLRERVKYPSSPSTHADVPRNKITVDPMIIHQESCASKAGLKANAKGMKNPTSPNLKAVRLVWKLLEPARPAAV